ncbi:hypothetical protein [Streptomyces sp. NBC_00582]|uniref:hypothetical protein n=1 Tax=Streptomyces sp. NBC_00582 TaxID=2975783 RepID=UPI002E8179EC|nr:hypothetical protein [Streptomyces sp. NBC_00582]WUB63561.1 hypothetical protein OG852_25800 [Streptomyces sp. NBC_00582]
MLLISTVLELLAYCAGLAVQAKLGALGVMLMLTVAIGRKAKAEGLTLVAVCVLVALMLRTVP